MGNSYLVTGALLGMDVRIVAPKALLARASEIVAQARRLAEASGARITLTEDVAEGVRGADFVATDVWVSMGEPKEVWDERIAAARAVRRDHGRPARHRQPGREVPALPARLPRPGHRRSAGRSTSAHGLTSLEVTDEVFESEHSVVFDEAENRMHTIKAILVATLGLTRTLRGR